uniref:CARD domain-containing protein n=1 Tax=Acanthochromis polyacanthus TaxID=80966 RepID=A0A3Q1FRN9_9TELE
MSEWLLSARSQLIQGLSDVTVNQLLDRLFDQRVISGEEKDVIRAQTGADKARQLIDRVHRKGPDAVSVLKTALSEVDPFLFRNLNLTFSSGCSGGSGIWVLESILRQFDLHLALYK